MKISITIMDERYGVETEHNLCVEISYHAGERQTFDCPGEDPWFEVEHVWVEGDAESKENCILAGLSDEEAEQIDYQIECELEHMK